MNESFLAIVNFDTVGQETVDLVIYKWRKNSFDKFSEIPPTLGKFGGAASFAIKSKTFINFRRVLCWRWESGQGRGSPDYKPYKRMKLEMWSRFKWMVKYSLQLQTKLVMEGNPTFLRGMEMSLSQSSHFLQLEPLPGIHLWCTLKPFWV